MTGRPETTATETERIACPQCHVPMEAQTLAGHLGRPIVVDICFTCQVFWFDHRESLRLSAASTLALFRTLGERSAGPAPEAGAAACPRCGSPLRRTQDQQRNTRFEYRRCPDDHGRLITFFNFLREKDFIRPLSGAELQTLRQNVQQLHCSNCGAAIDLAAASACGHCGAPVSMLDLQHAGRLVEQLQRADNRDGEPDPALPLQLAKARREVDAAFDHFERDTSWSGDVARSGLVTAGLRAIARWFT